MRKTMTKGRMFEETVKELATAVFEWDDMFEEMYPDDIVENEVMTEEEPKVKKRLQKKVVVLEGEVIDTPFDDDSWTEDEIREKQVQTWEKYYEKKRKKLIAEYTESYHAAQKLNNKLKKMTSKSDQIAAYINLQKFLKEAAAYEYLKEELEYLYYLKDNSYDFLNNIEKTEFAGHEVVLDWSDDYDEVAIRIIK